MRKADIFVGNNKAATLEELEVNQRYRFAYDDSYYGQPASLTMPTTQRIFEFDRFPPFFEGLLPEGIMLDSLLRIAKIDRNDLFGQLIAVGEDMVGNVSVREST